MVSILACSNVCLKVSSVAHAFHADLFKGGSLPDRMYMINLGLILTLVLQIISAVVYQLLSMATRSSKSGVGRDLMESLSFKTCFVYYSIFLILKMVNPLMYPVHWLGLSGKECSAYIVHCVHANVTDTF